MKRTLLPSVFAGLFALSAAQADTVTCTNRLYSSTPQDPTIWSDGKTPSPDNDYLVDKSGIWLTMGDTGKGATVEFTGRSLTIGGENRPSGVIFLGKDGTGTTSFPCGIDIYNATESTINIVKGNTHIIDGEIRLHDDYCTAPQLTAGTRAPNQTLIFSGKVTGNDKTGMAFFSNVSAGENLNTNDHVRFTGDLSSHYGFIRTKSGGSAGQNIVLELGNVSFPGLLDVAGGVKSVVRVYPSAATATVSKVAFTADSTLWVDLDLTNGTAGCLVATNALTVTGPVWVSVKCLQDLLRDSNAAPARSFPVLTPPEGVTLNEADFRLNLIDPVTGADKLITLAVRNNADSLSTLYVDKAEVLSPIRDVVNATWTGGAASDTAITAAGNWQDGLPSFSTGETLATFGTGGAEALVESLACFNGFRFNRDFALKAGGDAARVRLYAQGLGVEADRTVTLGVPMEIFGNQTWTLASNSVLNVAALHSTEVSALGVTNVADVTVEAVPEATLRFAGKDGGFLGSLNVKGGASVVLAGTNALGAATGSFTWHSPANEDDKAHYVSFHSCVEEKPITLISSVKEYFPHFKGDVEFKGAFTGQGTLRMQTDGPTRVVFSGGVSSAGSFCLNGSNAECIISNKPMIASMIQPDCARTSFACSGNCVDNDFGLNFRYGTANAVIKLLVPNCFDARTPLSMASSNKGHVLDLCGNDQTFGHFTQTREEAGAPQTDAVVTNSGAAATLHIVQNREKQRATTVAMCWIGGDLRGPIDFWKDGSARIVVTNAIHATGEIRITQGMFEFAPEASWLNATNVTVCGYEAASNACLKVVNGSHLDRHVKLNLTGAGTVDVPAGVTLRVGALAIDGVDQSDGIWRNGAVYSATARTTPLITGSGEVCVGSPGFFIIFR